ncbi:DUF5009 domain-containing protein [Verrucomicrobiales bacterium]|nr:hypothetical protein [bacterium]MDC0321929.1 DUF5009 domain-containing protein [Verrucomicrobiales bacterium]
METEKSPRLLSLDAYRGLVMFALATGGLGLAKVAGRLPDNEFLQFLKFHVSHPEWNSQFKMVGFALWDMIQPAFMFMVGVSMPYSYEKRQKLGHSFGKQLSHAWIRAILLILLGVFLQSRGKSETFWIFTNVLSQIGLGYGFLFFLVGKAVRTQVIVGLVILVGYFLLMLPRGFENGYSMPQLFDLWFLNLFPRAKVFEGHSYATLNFVPAFVTMLMGLMCGQLLKNDNFSAMEKLRRLASAGAVCLVAGLLFATVCPIVKKLWTPSWTLFSGAYVIWLLAIMYWVIDLKGWKRWTFFFVVVGLNPLAMYFMGMQMKAWTLGIFKTHLPDILFAGTWGPFVSGLMIALFFWLILWWMYRNRVFIRI